MDAVDGIQMLNFVVARIAFQITNVAFGFLRQIVVNMRAIYVHL